MPPTPRSGDARINLLSVGAAGGHPRTKVKEIRFNAPPATNLSIKVSLTLSATLPAHANADLTFIGILTYSIWGDGLIQRVAVPLE